MTRTGLAALVAALAALSLTVGVAGLSVPDVWEALVGRLPGGTRGQADGIVWSLRMPRLLAAVAIGAGLAVAGVAQQSFYRSRLADPYILGVSAASGLAAVLGVLAGVGSAGAPIVAAAGGAVYAVVLRRLTSTSPEPSRVVLIGLSLGIALTAWTLIAIFVADTPRLPTFTYYIFGSLSTAGWGAVWPTLGLVGAGWIALRARWRALDALSLGDAEAQHLGIDVARESTTILLAVGAVTGATVGLGGVIGFVGLLAPLLAATLTGASARNQLAVAAMAGMALVIGSDILARSIGGPVEVPIGIITSAVGAVLLVVMLVRRERLT